VRGALGVFGGCFGPFWVRRNTEDAARQHFKKKKGEIRGKKNRKICKIPRSQKQELPVGGVRGALGRLKESFVPLPSLACKQPGKYPKLTVGINKINELTPTHMS